MAGGVSGARGACPRARGACPRARRNRRTRQPVRRRRARGEAGLPIRDAAHAALLARFREAIHPSVRWMIEAPFPVPATSARGTRRSRARGGTTASRQRRRRGTSRRSGDACPSSSATEGWTESCSSSLAPDAFASSWRRLAASWTHPFPSLALRHRPAWRPAGTPKGAPSCSCERPGWRLPRAGDESPGSVRIVATAVRRRPGRGRGRHRSWTRVAPAASILP